MVDIWSNISRLGTRSGTHRQQQGSILLTNRLSVILFGLTSLAVIASVLVYRWEPVLALVLASCFFYVLVLLLNYWGYTSSSRLLLCIFVPVSTLFFTILGKTLRPEVEEISYFTSKVVLLFASVLPLILFQLKERIYLVTGLAASALCLLLFDVTHKLFEIGYYQMGFSAPGYHFFNAIIVIVYLLLVSCFVYYKVQLEKTESELWGSNEQLQLFYSELGMQHEEMNAQSEKLQESQQQLQEANQLIEQQKELLESENLQLQQHLLEKNKILESSNRELHKRLEELQHFSYTISHNLRGPVASLLGLASLFDLQKADAHNRELMQHAATAAAALDAVIRDLSQVLQMREGKEALESIDLEYLLENVMLSLKHEFRDVPVKIEIKLRVKHAQGVKPYLHSMFYNLISNAIKYRHPNRSCHIIIRTKETDTGVLLKVKDNGIGLNLEKHGHNLFKMYKRFNVNREGKGLGLYLIKTQAELLGGFVDVNSKQGEGSTFSIWLPQPQNAANELNKTNDSFNIL